MKKIISIFTLIIMFMFILFLINNNKVVLESITFSISIWKDNLIPNLFPFFILSSIIIEYNLIRVFNNIFSPIFSKMFHLPKELSYIFLISLISGFPSSSKYINDLLDKNLIDEDIANHLLIFTNYANPLFILGFIGNLLNKELAIIILICHILSGISVGYIFNINNKNYKKIDLFRKETHSKIGNVLTKSIVDSINTLLLLLGIVTVFVIISNFIRITFNFNNTIYLFISSILEMSQGVMNIGISDINIYLKTILITGIISFNGLSIHAQIVGILSKYKIKYKYFLLSRILHSIIAIILVSIIIFFKYLYHL